MPEGVKSIWNQFFTRELDQVSASASEAAELDIMTDHFRVVTAKEKITSHSCLSAVNHFAPHANIISVVSVVIVTVLNFLCV